MTQLSVLLLGVSPLWSCGTATEPAPEPVLGPDPAPPVAQDEGVQEVAVPQPPEGEGIDPELLAHLRGIVTNLATAQQAEYPDDAARNEAVGDAWADLGLAYEANTLWSRALPCYEMAIAYRPEKPEWVYRKGVALHAFGDLTGAYDALKVAAAELQNTTVVQARYGDVARLLGELDEAEAAWRQAIASEAQFSQPVKFPESRVGLAQVLIELEEYEEAEQLLREALTLNPVYKHAHYLLGTVLVELGDDAGAEFAFLRGKNGFEVFPPDPHQPRLTAHQAGYHRRMMGIENLIAAGDFGAASQAIEEVLQADPYDHHALNMKARALMIQGRHKDAYQILTDAEAAAPNHYPTFVELTIVCLNRIQGEPTKAQELMEEAQARSARAIELAPLVGRTWYARGMVAQFAAGAQQDPQAQGQAMQQALAFLQRAHSLGCEEFQMFQSMATISAQLGQLEDMVRYAESGTTSNPDNPGAWTFRAQVHLTMANMRKELGHEQLDLAEQATSRAAEVARDNPQVAQFAAQMFQQIDQVRQTLPPRPEKDGR